MSRERERGRLEKKYFIGMAYKTDLEKQLFGPVGIYRYFRGNGERRYQKRLYFIPKVLSGY